MVYYNITNTCDRCRENGIDTKLIPGKAYKEYNKERHWTGRYLCNSCWYITDYGKRPDSHNNLKKALTNRRTGNQDTNSVQEKGDNFQELTCIWRSTVSSIIVKDLNIENDNYSRGSPIDHSPDSELGIIQTKGRFYDPRNGCWTTDFIREWDKEFDYVIFYCANNDGSIIERIYIIPKEEVIKTQSIGIFKKPTCGRYGSPFTPWYEQYRVKDEKVLETVNEIWKQIIKRIRIKL